MIDWAVIGKAAIGLAFAATGAVAVYEVASDGGTLLPEPLRRELRAVDSLREELRRGADSSALLYTPTDTTWKRPFRPAKRRVVRRKPKLDTMEVRLIVPDTCSEEDWQHIQALLRDYLKN